MATNKSIELKEFTDSELASEIEITRNTLRRIKFDHSLKGIDNPLRIREARRDVARMLTEQRKRELVDIDPKKRSKIRARRRHS